MKITLKNTPETYQKLQPFTTLEQHNANIKAIRDQFNSQLTKSEKAVLDILNQYSAKYYGLSYLSKTKIAKMLDVSKMTVIRACRKFEKLGFIKQYTLKRHNGDGRQSANAIIFVEQGTVKSENVMPECYPKETLSNTKILSNTKDTEDLSSNVNDKEHLKASLPTGWYEQAAAYAKDAKDLYKITGELFKAKKGTNIKVEDHVDEFGAVIKQAWFSLKIGRVSPEKWYAYLYSAFKKTAYGIERQEKIRPLLQGAEAFFDPNYKSVIDHKVEDECTDQRNATMDVYLSMIM